MSITAALGSALTGLSATSRQAEILSSNVANATTPGYARREVGLRAAILTDRGQGVAITGITRDVDRQLLAERRLAQAADGDRTVRADFLASVERAVGTPDSAGSLAARVDSLDQALIAAAGRPESEARLATVANAARSLISGLASATDDIQDARTSADRQIAAQVGTLNSTLAQLERLNDSLLAFTGAGRDVSALLDERQRLVDTLSSIVPIREVPRDMNQIALYTTGGAPLLDGKPSVFAFTPTLLITPQMTQASGGLSGLTINDYPYDTAGTGSPILGGTLAAQFAVRDDLAVSAQGKLDAVARDLVERFSAPGLDATLGPGAPGLFTDSGAAFLPSDEIGLAGRLKMNAAADPTQGGALFRLRDGLGAATAGPPGNGAFLNSLHQALTVEKPLASTGFIAGSRDFATLTADILADTATLRLSAQSEQSFASGRLTALTDVEAQNGIDTDQEMQQLLIIEKNYSANARVIQTVSDMIDTLLRLGA
ncbi:flagellar hook-associated protein FlgK [Tabrizicola piscis]|uniref:Flagellar hook-associated protein 1 n=1 Tax=Tabrizicola piscis TaxID=2494374 RepID=A0A3S8U6L8_9RHOB|nr:flagellar hook-associated protein FlgK [Tabrizicola piscis]AZL59217.1 flagellar hook-associated protein FlgK [Tabrizicola piscis]